MCYAAALCGFIVNIQGYITVIEHGNVHVLNTIAPSPITDFQSERHEENTLTKKGFRRNIG